MDKIIIKNLKARGIIGVNDSERTQPQEILINAILFADTRLAAETDDISDCVNYSTMSQTLMAHAETAKRFTVEALANDLASLCLEEKSVHKVIIRVEKLGAVHFTESVGVEIERRRDMEGEKV